MFCCAECFGDRGLRKNIIPLLSTETANCSYCSSEDLAVVAPSQLTEYFELLASAYQADANGKSLAQWFRDDWGLLSRMDDAHANNLLSDILGDEEIVRRLFSPSDVRDPDRLVEWEKLRDELRYENRFFPEMDIDLERLELLLSRLILEADEVPTVWYRARIQTGEVAFPITEMGAPPNRLASHGRANPAGIPYLYLGSTQTTAISEIRPHTGEVACVADFRTPAGLKLVDLRQPRQMVSPFLLEDADDISRMRNDIPFLERLGDELTRPVVPQSAAIDYTPTQYLCEFIKKCGYDGVIYGSSVSEGFNLALFDPSSAQSGDVTQHRVTRVSVDVAPVDR
ncbi:MAG: RES family NAD+ phosphorylase [Armatimonadetes bacterium]|nr:RES family NAD+ phosphorylase [Armatimonadota bacterium]